MTVALILRNARMAKQYRDNHARAKCTQVIIEVGKEKALGVEGKRCLLRAVMAQRKQNIKWEVLPPSCIAEPPGVHFAHVTHSNDTNDEVV